MNEIILNKKIRIERCISQINRYYAMDNNLDSHSDYLRQDAIAMNLQRICELCLDIANYLIKQKKLGLPQNSADAFALIVISSQNGSLCYAKIHSKTQPLMPQRSVSPTQTRSINNRSAQIFSGPRNRLLKRNLLGKQCRNRRS